MAPDDEDGKLTAEELRAIGEDDPESGKRPRKLPSPALRRALADFYAKAEGLSGPALQAEVDRLVGQIVESQLAVAPASLKDDIRKLMQSMLESDPTLGPILTKLREAAEREAKVR